MKKRVVLSAIFVGAVIGATSIVSGTAAAAGPAAKSYQGTISLKRTCNEPDNNVNESAQFTGVALAKISPSNGSTFWMNTGPLTVTVAVSNVNKENPSVSVPSRTIKDDNVGISLTPDPGGKTYSLTVGPVMDIPATIKTGGETIDHVWGIQGQTASDVRFPADASHLKGTKSITETTGATVVLTWDLQLK